MCTGTSQKREYKFQVSTQEHYLSSLVIRETELRLC